MCMQNHQIDQLKEEISGKDLALVKEHFDHMKVTTCLWLFLLLLSVLTLILPLLLRLTL